MLGTNELRLESAHKVAINVLNNIIMIIIWLHVFTWNIFPLIFKFSLFCSFPAEKALKNWGEAVENSRTDQT